MEHVCAITPCVASCPETKMFMNWLNSRPQGSIMDFTEKTVRTRHPKCTEALKKMRRIYFPTMEFKCCRVYRGVIDKNLKDLVEHEQPVAVFMWKKSAKQKKIYTAALDLSLIHI